MNIVFNIIFDAFLFFQFIISIYIFLPFIFFACYLVLRALNIKDPSYRRPKLYDKNFRFGIIITAHEEVQFIHPLIDSILKQTYPYFDVIVVADACDITGLDFPDPRVRIMKPEPALHSKVKSIRYAISKFTEKPDAVIILDSDNLIHPSFLEVFNSYFQKGYKVVQADFKAKNLDTVYARLDAIGDMFNFFIDREAKMNLGLSSAIWGSGIAVDFDIYNEVSYSSFLGGFDKKLQSYLAQRVDRIAFAPTAILYDEKIASGKSLETQRTRWINAYFKYFKENLTIMGKGIKKGDFNLFFFGFITLRPPLFILFGFGAVSMIIDYFVNPVYSLIWLIAFASFVFTFVAIVIMKGRDIKFIKALFMLPFFVLRQFMALLKLKKAKKAFLKTTHTKVVFIDELINQ